MTDRSADTDRQAPLTERAIRAAWIWGPPLAFMTAIVGASSIQDLQTLPGDVSDKTAHFWAYFVLGALTLRALAAASWNAVTPRVAVSAWAIAAAFGATDEWHQSFVPGRTMALDDWVADAIGAAVAVSAGWIVARFLRREDRTV